jgi:hypothetical protein
MYPCAGGTGPDAIFDPVVRTPYGKQRVTLHARTRTRCRLAVLPRDQLDSQALLGVAEQQTSRLQPTTPTRPTATHGC